MSRHDFVLHCIREVTCSFVYTGDIGSMLTGCEGCRTKRSEITLYKSVCYVYYPRVVKLAERPAGRMKKSKIHELG